MAAIVNVLLHGVFGYVFRENHIEAYVPAVCGHIYQAGRDPHAKDAKPLARTEYMLTGVCGGQCVPPDGNFSPVLPWDPGTVDVYGKKFCKINLPHPAPFAGSTNQIWPLDAYRLGSIYAGRDAGPLNSLVAFPNMHCLVYESSGDPLKLESLSGGKPIDLSDPTPADGICSNVHIWCTTPPGGTDMGMDNGSTPDGHYRRAFAALVDLFPTLEVTIEFPDGFDPQAASPNLPPGVGIGDVDPNGVGPKEVGFGPANCRYANLIFAPPAADM